MRPHAVTLQPNIPGDGINMLLHVGVQRVLIAGLASFAMERLIFRRICERELTFSMITSFGVLIGVIGGIKLFWGVVPRPVPVPTLAQVSVLGTDVPVYRLIVMVAALLVYADIWLFLNRTITGKVIRAGIEDVAHVEGLGINVSRLFTITFIIAGTLSGLAGSLHAPLIMVDPRMDLEVLAFTFMVVIIGGLAWEASRELWCPLLSWGHGSVW